MLIKHSRLKSIVERVAKRVSDAHHPMIEDDVMELLENNIDYAYPILDAFLENSSEPDNYPTIEHQACLLLLCEILSYIHYSIEQERSWAIEFSSKLQDYIAKNAFTPEVVAAKLQHLLEIFHQTELEITDSIRQANAKLVENMEYSEEDNENNTIEALLEEIVDCGSGSGSGSGSGCEFELFENIISQTYQVIPLDIQIIMIIEMAQSENVIIQNAAVLMLLHPEPTVRRQIGLSLTQLSRPLSSNSLRRLIVLRNWVPIKEKPTIDKLIQQQRRKGVVCASWPNAEVIKILATGFDGIGSQSILALVKRDKEYHLAGLLFKELTGVREPLIFKSHKKKELDNIIKGMTADSPCLQVSINYLNQAIPHFLHLNLKHHRPPSPLLLNFAELIGCGEWPAERIQFSHIINKNYDQMVHQDKFTSYEKRVLKKSHAWLSHDSFANTWYEQDADVDNALMLIFKKRVVKGPANVNELIGDVCDRILEPRRQKWMERLLWMTLWAQANQKKRGPKWEDFLIIARKIQDGTPLLEIPLMQAICEETIYIAAKDLIED